MNLRNQILEQALTLPPEDREFIADLLYGSLPEIDFVDPDIAAAWSRETDRRIAAYDRGESIAIDADIFLENARRELERRRAERLQTGTK